MGWRRITCASFRPSTGADPLIPIASLECDSEEKQAHLYFENGCYVFYVGYEYKGASEFKPATHWPFEFVQVLEERNGSPINP